MRILLPHAALELIQGDITEQEVDAIVNAANRHLAGGGGVDGAIHRAGGATLMQELKQKYPRGCPTGDAVVTGAGHLRAKFVIHAVGPIYSHEDQAVSADLLGSAYARCLQLAGERECASIAFPSISTGVYGYPVDDAARIALQTAKDRVSAATSLRLARWVLFDRHTYNAFARAAREVFGGLALEP